jgi:hypothetical protein
LAVVEQHERIVKILIEAGAKANVKDADGKTPAELAPPGRIKVILNGTFPCLFL